MNRYFKLLFVAIFSGCIIAYTNLFNRSFFNGYCSNNATWQQSQGESDSHVANSLDLCRGDGVKQCIPPLMRFKQLYRTSKPNSLIACVIEKSFSTFLTAIMCFLHDPQTFKDSNRTLDSDIFGDRLCKDKNEFTELKKIGSWQKMSIFTVVRNPIDRFVSGFTDKCLRENVWKKFKNRCAGCKTNLTCFVDKMYDRMHRFARNPYKGIDFDDSHFFPQSWRCEFSSHLVKYQIFQLDGANFTNQLLGLLSERGVDENGINFINGSLHHRTPHSTMDSVERAAVEETVLSSPYLLRKIIQMYYFDFLLFGYKLPDIPVGN
ncbi:Carbohydrate sulfotransferase [Caenorhabditis elegans]|uniref:Carbohydrate sulfotransferase n=1 Tax=Caenorhabditis elegans TaxID=6239 RepID=Q688Z7_CAEEL|nr:Carbohydrate sulfotransferase [Caenorhabditis elegans]CCD72875.1 Carbohydrate sulfotransferase [Caenorhabditis elegans]|eukprot:NP_001021776.2 Uncharacterized protein CELE_Y48G1BL.7 [Caenorhabditis elegans]